MAKINLLKHPEMPFAYRAEKDKKGIITLEYLNDTYKGMPVIGRNGYLFYCDAGELVEGYQLMLNGRILPTDDMDYEAFEEDVEDGTIKPTGAC